MSVYSRFFCLQKQNFPSVYSSFLNTLNANPVLYFGTTKHSLLLIKKLDTCRDLLTLLEFLGVEYQLDFKGDLITFSVSVGTTVLPHYILLDFFTKPWLPWLESGTCIWDTLNPKTVYCVQSLLNECDKKNSLQVINLFNEGINIDHFFQLLPGWSPKQIKTTIIDEIESNIQIKNNSLDHLPVATICSSKKLLYRVKELLPNVVVVITQNFSRPSQLQFAYFVACNHDWLQVTIDDPIVVTAFQSLQVVTQLTKN